MELINQPKVELLAHENNNGSPIQFCDMFVNGKSVDVLKHIEPSRKGDRFVLEAVDDIPTVNLLEDVDDVPTVNVLEAVNDVLTAQ